MERAGAKIQAAQTTIAKVGGAGMFIDMEANLRDRQVKTVEQMVCMYSVCARSGGFLEKSRVTL